MHTRIDKYLFAAALLVLMGAGCRVRPSVKPQPYFPTPTPGPQVVGTALIDLNGDGKKEQIALSLSYAAGIPYPHHSLRIDDQTIDIPEQSNPTGHFGIVKIGGSDPKTGYPLRQIALGDEGPSSDPTTRFYGYDGSKILFLGQTQDFYENMRFAGDGTFTTMSRGRILDTWFHQDDFKLENGHIIHVPRALYERSTPVTLLVPMTFQRSPKDASPAFRLEQGSKAVITACDDIAWCRITADGRTGWFKIQDYGDIVVKGKPLHGGEVFDGLSFAD